MSENLLLAALPKAERNRLEPFLERVELKFGQIVIEPEQPIEFLYFPYDAISSTIQEMDDGSSVETGLMGVEGLVGVQLWLRVNRTPTRTIIQVPGRAHRISAEDFRREVTEQPSSELNHLIPKYLHAFLIMTSTSAACNRLHPVDERLCRWLKLIHNRIRRDKFPMTQEYLAMMLGAQRPTISTAAHILQKAGLIAYTRGQMTILDAEGLADGACECLEIMEAQFDKVFDQPWREFAAQEDKN